MRDFALAAGTVPGTYHTRPGEPIWGNSQDALVASVTEGYNIGIVCDGCGSMAHSEIGAKIGARLAAKSITRFLESGRTISEQTIPELYGRLSEDVASDIRAIAWTMADDPKELDLILFEYFLFTIVGFVMTQNMTLVFSFGDGLVAVNGTITSIEPGPNNMPAYVAYLVTANDYDKSLLEWRTHALIPTVDVHSLLIGSDGLNEFIAAEQSLMPVVGKPLGPLSEFWEEEKYFDNPDAVRRRLAMANREHVHEGRIQKGLLHDDTTLIVARRINNQQTEG